MTRSLEDLRSLMVADRLVGRGIRDARVLDAMARVPATCLFQPKRCRLRTRIARSRSETARRSRNFNIVAVMTQALALGGGERVLEKGWPDS